MAITTVQQLLQRNDFAGVGAAGTATVDILVQLDTMMRLVAEVHIAQSSGGHQATVATLVAKANYLNNNGTVTQPTAVTGSANPDNSGGLVSTDAESSTIGGTPTANYTISSSNARLTVTNTSASAADITVLTRITIVSNVVTL